MSLIGRATLLVGADLAPLDADLAKAEKRVAASTQLMQRMLDMELHVGGIAQTIAGLDAVQAAVAKTAQTTVAASATEVAAIKSVTDAYLAQAAAAKAASAASDTAMAKAVAAGGVPIGTAAGGTNRAFVGQGTRQTEIVGGVRNQGRAGTLENPNVVVIEAARYTPLGSLAAAVAENPATGGASAALTKNQEENSANVVAAKTASRPVPVTVQKENTDALATAMAAAAAKLATPAQSGGASDVAGVAALKARRDMLAGELKRAQWSFNGTENRNISGSPAAQARIAAAQERLDVARSAWEAARDAHEAAAAAIGGETKRALILPPGVDVPVDVKAVEGDAASVLRSAGAGGSAREIPTRRRAYSEADLAALGAALAGGSRVQKTAILRQLAREGRGSEVPAILAAGSGGEGGNGGLLATLGLAAGADKGGGGGGSPWRSILWGKEGGGGGMLGMGALAGAGTVGGLAGLGAEHVLFTGLGLAGSAASAAAGGGLIALGAAGQMAVGMGSDMAVMRSTITDTKSLETAYDNVAKAVAVYGKNSEQAKVAQKELNLLMQELGNTKGVKAEAALAKQADALNEFWDQATSNARVQAVKLLQQFLGVAHEYVPKVAQAAQENLGIINKEIRPLFDWIKGPEGVGVFNTLEERFKENLPSAMGALTQGFEFFTKTTREASKYTGGFTQMIDRFFTKWNSPHFFSIWSKEIGKLVHDFHLWLTLIKTAGRDVWDLFRNDAHTGNAIVETLTEMLAKLGQWERSTRGRAELHNIFLVHREEIVALLKLLPGLIRAFEPIYMTVAPPLVEALTAVAKGFAWVIEKLDALSPATRWALGLTLLAAKLGQLGRITRAVGAAFGFTAKRADEAAAAQTKLGTSATTAATEEEALGGAYGGVPTMANAGTAGEAAVGGGLLARAKAGLGGFKDTAIRGAVAGGVGYIVSNSLADALGLRGTANGAVSMAGLGAGIGMAGAGPLGALLGAGAGAGTDVIAKWLFGAGNPSKDVTALDKLGEAIGSVNGELAKLSPRKLAEMHREAVRLGQNKDMSKFADELAMIGKQTGPAMQALSAMGHHFHDTAGEAGRSLSDIRGAVQNWVLWIDQTMPRGSAEATSAMARAFLGAAQDVHVSMRNGVVSVSKGIAAMNRLMDEALSALGIEGGSHANLKQKKQAVQLAQEYPKAHLEIEGSGATIETAVKGAQGGVWQVGNPGEAGRDTVPLNVGGMPIVVAPGEQVVVFNRHQIPEANERFADYGGLPGFFAAHQRPNYMAAGGIAAPATHLGGALGDLAGGELRRVAAAMNRMLARVTPGAPGRSGWGAASANEALGRQMMLAAGWPVSEWPYLQKLWQRESGWNAYAMNNPSMGWLAAGNASGIPQADGHGYVFAPGDARAQIAWGLADIRSVYGSPRAAWAHELAHGWYAGGGLVRGGAWGAMARRLDAAAQRRYKPTAMNFRPFATIPSLKTMPGAFNHGLSTLNALLGSHGSVASLQERYSDAERADSLTPAGSEEFVVEGPEGSAHLNMAAIEARLAQLEHLAHLQVLVHGDLHHALGLVGRLEHTITRAIAYRRKQVAKIKARIQKIRAAIRARARLMKTLEHRIAQDQQKLGHLYGKAHAGERHAVHGEIHALRGELHAAHGAQHSDEATRQHLEHNLGILGAQDRSLHERASALSEDRWGIIGASKHGGTLGESSYALAQLAQQMQPLREATRGGGPLAAQVAKALAEGVGGYEGYGSAQENREQLSASLKEQNERLQQELFVSQQQYKVFAALPPFGGTFHSGGIVPGPVGAERLALVKGGEVISPGGSPSKLEVHVLDGAVDPNKIAVIADGVVQQHTRQAGRAFNTPLPSRGGGW